MQDISECLSLEAQNVAEARLAAKRAARAEAREIRMKELERQQKETNGYEEELLGPSQYRKSSRNAYYSDLSLASAPLPSKQQQQSVHNGSRPSLLNCNSLPSRSQRGSLYDEGVSTSSRRSSGSRPPSEYSCYLGSGSRASSRASSARASPVVEERPDKDFGEKGSRPVSSLSAATLASLGGTSSRRGSGDTSISVDTEASIREIKDSLAEVEEKYKRSMVTNAQLDNEKTSLQYQVDTLRDVLLELEEELAESRRQYEDKHKESERQKHDQNVLRFQLSEMKEALEQRESLLTKHGIPLDSVGTPNGDASLDPHVNADGRPDPPIRTTSMGPSEEAVEKKETMPVVGEIPPSKAEQTNQEELLSAPSETQQNAEVGDKVKEQNIQETASSSNDAYGTLTSCQTNLEHQEGGPQLDLELTSNEYALDANECALENVNRKVFVQNLSEVQKEETMEQKNTSPEEIEVFQDALDNVVQSPCLASEGQSISAGDFGSKDHNIGQQDFSKEVDRHEVQSTSVPITSGPNKEASVITDDKNDHHAETKDEHETSSTDDSSQDDSEESTADEMTIAAIEDQKVCEMEVKPEEQSVPDESGLLCKENDSDKSDSNTNATSSEQESISTEATIHADICIVVESDITPEQCLQDVQFTKEKRLVESENNNFGEVAGPCILSNRQSTVDNEALEVSEALKDSVSLVDQHEDATDAGILNIESPENGKTSTVFLGAQGTSQLLNKREQDTFFDHPVCGDSENMNEKADPFVPIAPAIELLGEGKQAKTSDHSDKIENTNDKVPVVAETPKEAVVSETLSSEGESTPEGEESDENNDEDVAVRSEKYTGESLPLGSSVDQISSDDDIRMEDGSDKASRRGKGKNKEDCVVS